MITEESEKLIQSYIEWFKKKIDVKDINGVYEVITPFLDRHNDYITLYIKKSNGNYILTDDGYTIQDLRLSGCELNTEKRRQVLDTILNGFGVQLQDDELMVETKYDNFPQKKHNLIQAMLSINDLFAMASPIIVSLFREDVEKYLQTHEIRFVTSVKFPGKSGFDHLFDFVIPASRIKPERVIKAINDPNRQNISSFAFAWNDIKAIRQFDSDAYAILNDTENPINRDHINALNQYGIKAINWSHKEEYVEELAA
jgi:hypothetical protein